MVMKVVEFVSYLKRHLKYALKIRQVSIDTKVFQLHYRWTPVILLLFSGVLTVNQWVGKPISCLKSGDDKCEQKVIERFCWIEGTFIVDRKTMDLNYDMEMEHPGIVRRREADQVIETSYYQWVTVVLFFHAFSFCIPHRIWKNWEKGCQAKLVNNLFLAIDMKKDLNADRRALTKHLFSNRGKYVSYAYRFFICEILNLLNLILNAMMIDWFLSGKFWTYGLEAMKGTYPSPMVMVFPTLTKCIFFKFGSSGDVQKTDHLCLLPLNIINEKIYLLIWWWFSFLFIITVLSLLYKVAMIMSPTLRYFLMSRCNRMIPKKYFNDIIADADYGDWFVIYLLSKNLDPFHFRVVMINLGEMYDELAE